MEDKREKIIGKIRKLLRLEEGARNIGSEGEADKAAEMVTKLLKEYNLSLLDISGAVEEQEKDEIRQSDPVYAAWDFTWELSSYLLSVVTQYNDCSLLSNSKRRNYSIVGTETSVMVCRWLYEYLTEAFSKLGREAFRKLEHEEKRLNLIRMASPPDYRKFKNKWMKSYLLGCVGGLNKQLADRQVSQQEEGLTLYIEGKIDEWFSRKMPGVKTKRSRKAPEVMGEVFRQGLQEGEAISLNLQVEDSSFANPSRRITSAVLS